MNQEYSSQGNISEPDDLDSLRQLIKSHPSQDKIGKYEIVEFLGQGGMGKVYRAYDPQLIRTVAIKVIDWKVNRNVQKRRLLKEAQATARLSHPNIVKIYEIGEDDQNCYLVMEYIEGCNLSQYLKQGIPSHTWTLNTFYKIALAIHHSHKEGILHRDLKPADIMITKDGEPKVMDFGLAKVLSEETSASSKGKIVGTIQYMSPEQVKAKKLDERSDVFSLGVLLYEMLCGKRPFPGTTTLEVAFSITGHTPESLKALVPTIPTDIEAICLKCLHKEKQRRYQNANLLAKDIKRYQDFFPVHAMPRTFFYIASKWIKRNHSILKASVAIFFMLLLVLWNCYIYKQLQQKKVSQKENLSSHNQQPFKDTKIKSEEDLYFMIADLWASIHQEENFIRIQKKIEFLKKLFPDSPILYKEAGNMLFFQWIRRKNNDLMKKALDDLEKSVSTKPDDNTAFSLYYIYGLHNEVEKQRAYRKILCKDNAGYSLYFQAKDLFQKLYSMNREDTRKEDYEEAISYCQKSLEHIPSSAYSYALMAYLMLIMDSFDQALAHCQKALDLSMEQAYSFRFPKYKEIIKEDQSFITLFYLELLVLQARIYEKKNQKDMAVASYSKAILYSPYYCQALLNRGEIYYKQGELSLAIEDFNKAIEEKYQMAKAYRMRGNSYFGLKKYDKAIEDYNTLILMEPEKSESYLLRSGVYQEMKQYSNSIADIESALRLDPKNRKIQFLKNVLYKLSKEENHNKER